MKILFLSLSDRKTLYPITFDRTTKYCKKYSYNFDYKTSIIDNTRHISWSKIPFLLEKMNTCPDYNFYVWLDDDIYITNFDIDFYTLIESYDFNCLLLSKDVIPECPLNAGVLVCKNNPTTTQLLNKIYDMVDETGTRFEHNWEQDALIKYYYEQNNNNDMVTIPHRIIQSFYRNYLLPSSMKWKPNDFCAHITGMNMEQRIAILNRLEVQH
jgi:hypothetical protein